MLRDKSRNGDPCNASQIQMRVGLAFEQIVRNIGHHGRQDRGAIARQHWGYEGDA
jgi:hypothetical protein